MMSDSLRIAILVGTFPVVSETFILRQITGLLDLGHEVDIYADSRPEPGSPVHAEVEKYGLLKRTIYMDMPAESAPWEMPVWPLTGRTWTPGESESVHNLTRVARALPKVWRPFVTSPRLACQTLSPSQYCYQAASLSALYRLAQLATQRKRYDVIHAHFGPVANSFRFARALWKAPLVVSFHGYDFTTLPRQEGVGMYEKLFATADVFTVNSCYTRRCVEKLGCPPSKIEFLPVGLNLEEFGFRARTLPPGEPVRVLSVGRLVEVKGHEFLVRAMARLQGRPVICDIVGDGPLRGDLQALIDSLGSRNVTLHGARSSAAVRQMMAESHIFVLGSVSVEGDQEGQGLVLQEAQACGLPVIATRHGALPEGMLDGQSGFLVPEKDVAAMAERLEYLAGHPEIWPGLGRCGREFVAQRYDIGQLNCRLTEIYKGAINQFRS